jgi:RNA polymerase sigma-70 factor (ECF subfamily)
VARWQGFYDELATTRYAAVLAYAMALTGQRATAEDLVQEALVKVFSSPRRLASAAHAESYVRRTVASLYVDDARRAALFDRTARRMGWGEEPKADAPPEPTDELEAALARLSPQVRTCVVLRFYEDLTAAQIADRLGLAVGTVKRYLHEASADLREDLGVDADPDGGDSIAVVSHAERRR